MGQGLALRTAIRAAVAVCLLTALAGCGSEKPQATPVGTIVGSLAKAAVSRVGARRAPAQAAPAPVTRADLEKFGVPILRAVIPVRSADALLTASDAKGGVITWTTTDGTTFTLRDGVLIQTRGLGPDLMSAQAPTAAQLRTEGATHQRVYFFLGANDQPTRRSYDCTMALVGSEEIEIFERVHKVEKFTETCARAQGSITNTFWFEGDVIRKSQQLASGGIGFIDFEQVID